MTLPQLCDALFHYMCALNRLTRLGAAPAPDQVEDELEAIFADMRSKSRAEGGLAEQYEKVEFPLLFFADNLIVNNLALPFAGEWPRLAYKRGENNGDNDFFTHLQRTLEDRGAGADERLAVFYTCIGLGFTGWYTADTNGPEILRGHMGKIEQRIRRMSDTEEGANITPEAYKHTNREDLTQPPTEPVTKVVLALVSLTIVVVVTNVMLYNNGTSQVSKTLADVHNRMTDYVKQVAGQ